MPKLYDAYNKLLCVTCQYAQASNEKENYCFTCAGTSRTMDLLYNQLDRDYKSINNCWETLYFNQVDASEMRIASENIKRMLEKLRSNKFYKLAQAIKSHETLEL